MYSFDGKHRQKPGVSLGGASKKEEKSVFMEKRLLERQQRQTVRNELAASIRIQKFVRGCLCRKREARKCRSLFDREMQTLQHQKSEKNIDLNAMSILMRLIGFFFNPGVDHQRLITLCQKILKLHTSRKISLQEEQSRWLYQFKTLLHLCLRDLEHAKDPTVAVAVPLRMLEVFTSVEGYSSMPNEMKTSTEKSVVLYLIEKGYFRCLRTLINNKVPPSVEISARPPTPLAATIKDLILKPIFAARTDAQSTAEERDTRTRVMTSFANEILCSEMSDQIFMFLIPSIAAEFPLIDILDSILESTPQPASFQDGGRNKNGVTKSCHRLRVNPTPWLLYSLLTFGEKQIEKITLEDLTKYLITLKILVPNLPSSKSLASKGTEFHNQDSDSDSDSDQEMEDEPLTENPQISKMMFLREHCIDLLDSREHVRELVSLVESSSTRCQVVSDERQKHVLNDCIEALCHISYALLTKQRMLLHKTRLLHRLAFSHGFMRGCWSLLSSLTTQTGLGKDVLFLNQLARGSLLSENEQDQIIPTLAVFCTLFRHALFCVYDTDFYGPNAGKIDSMMPFTLKELSDMSQTLLEVIIGLIQMMFSETRTNVVDAYGKAMLSVGARPLGDSSGLDAWGSLCQSVTQLVKQLHARDNRHQFCPDEHWLSPRIAINADQVIIEGFFEEQEQEDDTYRPGMSALTARSMAILRHIPFSVPFLQRVKIFQRILNQDKQGSQDGASDFMMPAPGSFITVNRKYLYQDAYDQLSQERAPDIKKKVRIKMINAQGLDEAGIDGGGIFREFMSQLVKQGFDPSYGFFKSTSEQLLYPNPHAAKIVPDCLKHFHFLGRMLGKVIYENMMVEMPFAPFFLCKLLNKHSADVDIHHLESLDPELYRNLLSLKNYDGDFDDIALNFTVINGEFGDIEVEELKPGGRDIPVTSLNKIEYIHLMADYRLNKQIRAQCNAFRAGLSDVINIEWLQMFDHRELQVLISGAPVPVDLEDLRENTNYSGGYADDHAYIEALWEILQQFNDGQRRKFIKFVTSCSRPPLLGFKELYPKMCIHYGGNEDRLPSASTCMNILKLPEYKDKETLKTRLLYAVESEAGFELS